MTFRSKFLSFLQASKNPVGFLSFFSFLRFKETTLERGDLTYTSAANVCNSGEGGANVYNFLSFQFLSAVVPGVLSKDSKDRLTELRPTNLEASSF